MSRVKIAVISGSILVVGSMFLQTFLPSLPYKHQLQAVQKIMVASPVEKCKEIAVADTINSNLQPTCKEMAAKSTINFNLQPSCFVEQMAECLKDDKCQVKYFHVGKTGGTTIESRYMDWFPPPLLKLMRVSCCNDWLVNIVERHMKEYCGAKFTSFQVNASAFEKIIADCREFNPPDFRTVALVSFRDPSSQTLSTIHQTCNKNFQKRSQHIKDACRRCDYDKDSEVWDGFSRTVNRKFNEIQHVRKTMNDTGVTVLAIELPDIDRMFEHVAEQLGHGYNTTNNAISNPEKRELCSFGMTSPMFKLLSPSQAIYRELVLGHESL